MENVEDYSCSSFPLVLICCQLCFAVVYVNVELLSVECVECDFLFSTEVIDDSRLSERKVKKRTRQRTTDKERRKKKKYNTSILFSIILQ